MWIRRIHDHDGDGDGEGGLALWLRLAEGVGLDREEVAALPLVLPGVRFACDAYVELVRERTPGRGGGLVADRVLRARPDDRAGSWPGSSTTPGCSRSMLAYFRARVPRARRDSEEAIDFVAATRRPTSCRSAAWPR